MSSLAPADVDLCIRSLASRGGIDAYNHDGWGFAYYDNKDIRLFKEAVAAGASSSMPFLRSMSLCSQTVLAHIRHVSQGTKQYADTQPFVRELGGRQHAFAHNGDLEEIWHSPELSSGNASADG